MSQGISDLFGARLKVINVGLAVFAESLCEQGIEVAQVDWRPPAGGDMELIALLDKLAGGARGRQEDTDGQEHQG